MNDERNDFAALMARDDFPELAAEYQSTRRALGLQASLAGLAASAFVAPGAIQSERDYIDPPFKSIRKKPSSKRRAKVKAARKQSRQRRAGR